MVYRTVTVVLIIIIKQIQEKLFFNSFQFSWLVQAVERPGL